MLGGISIWQLVIVLAIVIMIFGTKKLRSMGGDIGGAVKGFKKAMNEEDKTDESKKTETLNHNKEQADANFADTSSTQTEKDETKS